MRFPADIGRVAFVLLGIAVVELSIMFGVNIEKFASVLRVTGLVVEHAVIAIIANCVAHLLAVRNVIESQQSANGRRNQNQEPAMRFERTFE